MALLTLGTIELAGQRFPQPQALLLLAYLRIEGRKERAYLAQLFWPEAKRPLNNLSSALTRLRSVDPTMVVADRYTVGAQVPTDTERFVEHATADRHDEALDIYRGRFLDGFPVNRLGIELEEWVLAQRAAFAGTARDCACHLALRSAERGHLERAREQAERAVLIGRDAVPEPTLLTELLPILRTTSSPLADEIELDLADFGGEVLTPDHAATGDPAGASSPVSSPGDGIRVSRSFFGRERELEELDRALAHPGIVAVTGLGGVGKTELARTAFHDRDDGKRPTNWIDASLVDSIDRLIEVVGRSLFPDEAAIDHPDELAALIGRRPRLVAIDDIDNIADGLDALVELTTRCTGLTVLVTSRARPTIETIHTVALTGLPVLQANGDPGPAMDLFASWFARVAPAGASLPSADAAAAEICRLLDGHPLGIELAAGWLNVLTPAEIASGLAGRSADTGLTSLGDPDGLRSVLDGTWQLLDPSSRRALARLAVVPGGFDRTVAQSVGDCSLLDLRRLADWSLISRQGGRWYRCHPLVKGYALDQLERLPADEADAEQALTNLVIEAASDAPRADSFETAPPLEGFEDPVACLVTTWRLLLDRPDLSAIGGLVDSLDRALVRLGRQPTLLDLLVTTAKRLENDESTELKARIEMHLVWLHIRLGAYPLAASIADRLLGVELPEPDLVVELTRARSAIDRTEGDVDRALNRLLPVRELAAGVSERMLALVDNDIGVCQMVLGLYPESRESYRSVLAWARREGSQPMIAWTLLSLGIGHHDSGEILDSLAYLVEAKAVVTVNELAHIEPFVDAKLARGYLADGDHGAARGVIERARSRSEDTWEPWLAAEFELVSAGVAAARDKVDEMWVHLDRGLSTATDLDDIPFVAKAYVAIVDLGSRRPEVGPGAAGGPELAASVAQADSGADFADRVAAAELLDRLGVGIDEVEAKPIADRIDEGFAYLRRGRLLTSRVRTAGPAD